MVTFIVVAAAYGLIFVVIEIIAKRLRPPKELARKLSHILAGLAAALLPFVITFPEIALLGALFVVAAFVSLRGNIFKAMHGVNRKTYGEVYFPLGIAICALLFPEKLYFMYGVLVLGVSDALASLVGTKYGRKTHKAKKSKKTYVGSTVFFISTFLIGFGLTESVLHTDPWLIGSWSAVLAAILTYIEARGHNGLDNLYIPLAASGMLAFLGVMGLLGN
jgi:phytol kinase